MDVIKTYLDNVFAAYPQTNEVQSLRQDMLANMEEKYSALRQSGKSEHEAAYSVIADFGNIEEITTELGLGQDAEENVILSLDEAEAYLEDSKKSGITIGLGVWLIIAGVSSFAANTALLSTNGMLIMFSSIAVAVVMFIVNSNKMSAYGSFEEQSIRLDSNTRAKIDSLRSRIRQHHTIYLCVGIVVILFSVMLMTGEVASIDLSPALFLVMIGFSVFLFIKSSSYKSAFDILLGEGEYANKKAVKKSGQIIGTIAAVYWPVVTAIGLWQLFAGNGNFWVVWPVGGVLFGGICGGIAVWFEFKDKERTN